MVAVYYQIYLDAGSAYLVIIIKACYLFDLSTGVQFAFVPASYTVLEGNQVSLTIVKTGAAVVPVNVALSTAGETATGSETQYPYIYVVS